MVYSLIELLVVLIVVVILVVILAKFLFAIFVTAYLPVLVQHTPFIIAPLIG